MSKMKHMKQANAMILILLHRGHFDLSLDKCRVMADGAGGSVCFISGSLLYFSYSLCVGIVSIYTRIVMQFN